MGKFDQLSEPFNENDLPSSVQKKPDYLKLDEPFSNEIPTDAKLAENAREVMAANTNERPSLNILLAAKERLGKLINLNKKAVESDKANQERILAAINRGETIELAESDLEEIEDVTKDARLLNKDGSLELENADLEEIEDVTKDARLLNKDGSIVLETADLEEVEDLTKDARLMNKDGSLELESADLEEVEDLTKDARLINNDGSLELETADLEEIPELNSNLLSEDIDSLIEESGPIASGDKPLNPEDFQQQSADKKRAA